MRHSCARVIVIVCSLLGWQPSAVHADPIRVSGTLVGNVDAARIHLVGEGFTLQGSGTNSGGIYTPAQTCEGVLDLCTPGTPLSLAAEWSGSDFQGTATYNGVPYNVGMHLETQAGAFVRFTGSVLVPEYTGIDLVSVFGPIDFTGSFFLPFAPGVPQTTVRLFGRGTGRIDLSWATAAGGGWQFRSAMYELEPGAPVPEPATLLLVGSGIAAGVLRRKMRQRPSC